jgi:hypothetical protein
MSNTNTGGPAFASQLESNRDGYAVTGGMHLRDYFAAKGVQGMFASGNLPESVQDEELATSAYAMTDAMLKAREV